MDEIYGSAFALFVVPEKVRDVARARQSIVPFVFCKEDTKMHVFFAENTIFDYGGDTSTYQQVFQEAKKKPVLKKVECSGVHCLVVIRTLTQKCGEQRTSSPQKSVSSRESCIEAALHESRSGESTTCYARLHLLGDTHDRLSRGLADPRVGSNTAWPRAGLKRTRVYVSRERRHDNKRLVRQCTHRHRHKNIWHPISRKCSCGERRRVRPVCLCQS